MIETMNEMLVTHGAKSRSAAHNVGNMLLRIDADSAIKFTFLRDYVEQLVRWAVGPEYTASFVEKCLSCIFFCYKEVIDIGAYCTT